jgi:hypothetical protein
MTYGEMTKPFATTNSLSSPGLTGRPSTLRPIGSIADFPAYWMPAVAGHDKHLRNTP